MLDRLNADLKEVLLSDATGATGATGAMVFFSLWHQALEIV